MNIQNKCPNQEALETSFFILHYGDLKTAERESDGFCFFVCVRVHLFVNITESVRNIWLSYMIYMVYGLTHSFHFLFI